MNILDLFCGVGGASAGYETAGHTITGIDINPQPNYPYKFTQANVLDLDTDYIKEYDFIHASPPCQHSANITKGTNAYLQDTYSNLYPIVKQILETAGVPYVIENPDSRADITLCGEMFGLSVIRHRKFELGGWKTVRPQHITHRGYVRGWRHGIWRDGPYLAAYGDGGGKASVEEMKSAMEIPWAQERKELTEAIPPAYTQWIGERI